MHLNIEIKARCSDPSVIRQILLEKNARFVGTDHQVDTYFKVPHGRLKLREGNIENALIHYQRNNQEGPKRSEVILYKSKSSPDLKAALTAANGILKIVDKRREIYFIDNVKFHLDEIIDLGSFVEIEAIDKNGSIGQAKLDEQCNYFMNLFGIKKGDLIAGSYADLIGS